MGNKRTEVHNAIVEAVTIWSKDHAYGMSFRDLALLTNLPLGTCHEHARILREEGKITFEDHIARSIKLP